VVWRESPDCVYHLRRARFAVANFPKTIIRDPLINFPEGGICIWPPLFDVALALPARMIRGAHAEPAEIERLAFWVPLVFAGGAILAAGLAGLALRKRLGAIAALSVAVCPGFLQYSQFGHTDQHVAEAFWGFLSLAFFLRASRRDSLREGILSGLCLTAAVLTWQGAIFWAGLYAGALAAALWRGRPERTLRRAFPALGLPAAAVAALTAYWLSGFRVPFTYVSFGWFQPTFLAATFAGYLGLYLIVARRTLPAVRRRLVAAAALLSALPVLLTARSFFTTFAMGVRHLSSQSSGSRVVLGGLVSYSRDWLSRIVEYRPLLADGWDWPIGLLSFGFFLSPVAIALWARRLRRSARPEVFALLVLWASFTFLWTLFQRRNVYYASLLGALATLEVSAWLGGVLRRRLPRSERRRAAAPLALALFSALALPMLLRLPKELASGYSPPPDLREVQRRLRELVPAAVDPYDARFLEAGAQIPDLGRAEGVMAFWSQGHFVTYFAERPVVADNFGYNFFDCLHFFFAEEESDALAIARAHRARYVLAMDLLPVANEYAESLGRAPYAERNGESWIPLPRYRGTLQARLYDFDGRGGRLAGGLEAAPLSNFRLLYDSGVVSARGRRIPPRWKIFEITDPR
jgi:asparagine N-glycosylation enzyme membrane subunit Stt3